jgi:hypothetical protein
MVMEIREPLGSNIPGKGCKMNIVRFERQGGEIRGGDLQQFKDLVYCRSRTWYWNRSQVKFD